MHPVPAPCTFGNASAHASSASVFSSWGSPHCTPFTESAIVSRRKRALWVLVRPLCNREIGTEEFPIGSAGSCVCNNVEKGVKQSALTLTDASPTVARSGSKVALVKLPTLLSRENVLASLKNLVVKSVLMQILQFLLMSMSYLRHMVPLLYIMFSPMTYQYAKI